MSSGAPTRRAHAVVRASSMLLAAALSLGVGACWHDVDPNPAGGAGGSGGAGGETATSSTGVSTGSTTEPPGCQMNSDCVEDPSGPICNLETGECVSCFSVEDPARLRCAAKTGMLRPWSPLRRP